MSNFYGKLILINRSSGRLLANDGAEMYDSFSGTESLIVVKTGDTIIGVDKMVNVIQNLKPTEYDIINNY